MNNPKISIIVPVYKAEAFLHRSIDSILAQSFTDFEVLLIDDGSPDESGAICDAYAQMDSRIRVIHQANQGVSAVRQRGIELAKGEFVIHIDSDDWVTPDMLESLYEKAMESNADMIICDFYCNYSDREEYIKQQPTHLNHKAVLEDLLYNRLHGACWNKLVRLSLYGRYGVRFPKHLNYCEDYLTWAQLFQYPIIIAYHPKAYYHYDQCSNDNSLTRKYTISTFEAQMDFYHRLSVCIDNKLYKVVLCDIITRWAFEAFVHNIFSASEYRSRFFRNIPDFLRSLQPYKVVIYLLFASLGMKDMAHKCFLRKNSISYI